MKLYATITSERASKGQGGNKYLDIALMGNDEAVFAHLSVVPTEWGYHIALDGYDRLGTTWDGFHNLPTEKGKRQKGEDPICKHGVNLKYDDCLNCDKGQ